MPRQIRWWFLVVAIAIAMLAPIWLSVYPPIYDYPNHLLEAQVMAQYRNPRFGYAEGYEVRSGWFLQSNAMSTLLLIVLGQVMPMIVAGRLVLSLYLVLFLGGAGSLLRRTGSHWLVLLIPILAYNFTFTSGWINFSYGAALSLYALSVYLRWQEQNRRSDLLILAMLLLLIYVAHLMAWMLLIVTISAMMAIEQWRARRHGVLFLAMNSALPMLLITRPMLALLAVVISPGIWSGAALLHRVHLRERTLVVATLGMVMVGSAMVKLLNPTLNGLVAEVRFSTFSKKMDPLRLFSLPHQTRRLDLLLSAYNFALVLLLVGLAALLVRSTLHSRDNLRRRCLAATGLLGLLYIVIPSRTTDIWFTEPRVLLFVAFVLLIMAQWPPRGTGSWRLATTCVVILFLSHVAVTMHYTALYDRQAQIWSRELAMLTPARSVLMLRSSQPGRPDQPVLFDALNTFYSGEHFSTMYVLQHGGFVSRIFDSGPVRPRQSIPIPLYYWASFDNSRFIRDQCAALRATYDAVLVWGVPHVELETQLDRCFANGRQMTGMAIWRRETD